MRALVTGGNGFLGRYIVEGLLARGDDVRVFGRGNYPELEKLGASLFRGDLVNLEDLSRATRGVDAVFHVASYVMMWGIWENFYRTNVLGTRNVIEACRANGVKKLIYTSTPSVAFACRDLIDADETTPLPDSYNAYYPKSKAIAEREVLAANGVSGLYTVALRPHLLWGPRDNHLIPKIVERAKQGRLYIVGSGENIVDFTFVQNASDAHLLACDYLSENSPVAGKAYFISQSEPVKLWDFVSRVVKLHGYSPPRLRLPFPVAYILGAFLELLYGVFKIPGEPRMTRFLASQLSHSHYFSNKAAERDFNYRPKISLEEGLRKLKETL